jgi:hypothetical protein
VPFFTVAVILASGDGFNPSDPWQWGPLVGFCLVAVSAFFTNRVLPRPLYDEVLKRAEQAEQRERDTQLYIRDQLVPVVTKSIEATNAAMKLIDRLS